MKKIPKLRFAKFDSEYTLKELKDLGYFKSGTGFPEKEQGGELGIPFYKVSDMNILGNEYQMNFANNYVETKQIEKNKYKIIKDDSLIFAKVGAAIFLERKRMAKQFILDNNMMAFIPSGDVHYYYYLFQTIRLSRYAQVGALPSYNATDLAFIKVFIPTEGEQKKIATFLSAVDKKIQQLNREKKLMEQYKKGVMQKLFSQEIRFKDENGQNYPNWEKRKFNQVLFEHKLKSTGNEEVYSVSVHKGLINQIEHLGRSFAAATTGHYNLVKPNDIVYTKSPTGNFPLGIIKQSKIDKDVIISPLYGVFTPETFGLGYMLNVYFESPINAHNYLHSIIQKGAKNTISITNSKFLSKSLLLPISKEEQNKIGSCLKELDRKISLMETQINQFESFKKGLLQQMFI